MTGVISDNDLCGDPHSTGVSSVYSMPLKMAVITVCGHGMFQWEDMSG